MGFLFYKCYEKFYINIWKYNQPNTLGETKQKQQRFAKMKQCFFVEKFVTICVEEKNYFKEKLSIQQKFVEGYQFEIRGIGKLKNCEFHSLNLYLDDTHPVFPCLKRTMETPEQCVKFVQS